jgi:D-glycero-D-manno-heptose 1,7-bisphosphate phosphatase
MDLHRGLLLDRDDTIMADVGPCFDPNRVQVLPGIASLIALASANEVVVAVVTNQPWVARGMVTLADVDRVHAYIRSRFPAICAFYVCPHDRGDKCLCRKPMPGLVTRALSELRLDPRRTVMIGDKLTDVEAAHRAGIRGLMCNAGISESLIRQSFRVWMGGRPQ